MIPQYEYTVTGFIFGLIVALDIMCIANIISALIKRKRKEQQKEREELIKLAKQVNPKLLILKFNCCLEIPSFYEDLPLKYRKVLKDDRERES